VTASVVGLARPGPGQSFPGAGCFGDPDEPFDTSSLSKEFGPTAWSVSLWVKQDARDGGKGDGGLTSEEREELARLRRENRKLKEEREILSKAAAWFATEGSTSKRSSGS
jgi:transposase